MSFLFGNSSNVFRAHLTLAALFLGVCGWLATGTLAPYAATTDTVRVSAPCHYLVNEDYSTFKSTFYFLDGKDRSLWESSVVLRRILYPLVAFPFMKMWGFELGGFITNEVLHLIALVALAFFLRRVFGEGSAIWGMWLFATYPGIYYWVGSPYCYAAIVPVSIASLILLWRLQEDTSARFVVPCLLLGMLFLAYDVFPFFGIPALILVAIRTRRLVRAVAAGTLLLGPSILTNLILERWFHMPFRNLNTASYGNLLDSYLHWPDMSRWLYWLKLAPYYLRENYMSSNFVVFAWLFLALVMIDWILGRRVWSWVERLVAMGTLLFWGFLNLAPPNDAMSGTLLRGEFAPRFYQPFFIVILLFAARLWGHVTQRDPRFQFRLGGLLALAVAVNVFIMLGPLWNSPYSARVYARFYKHAPRGGIMMVENLQKYGRRPFGFCQEGSFDGISAVAKDGMFLRETAATRPATH